MLKSAVSGMGSGISEHLTGIAGLPDGTASLEAYFDRFGVTMEGRRVVLETFRAPARRVGTGRYNTTVRYVSRKMDREIQIESRTVEGPYVEMLEQDPNVVMYLCQPVPVYVRVTDAQDRVSRRPLRFDYLVLHVGDDPEESGFWIVECKRTNELETKSGKPNARFMRDGSRWRFPAAEEAVEDMGLRFRVFASEEINNCWCMNMNYLSDFVGKPCPDEELAEALVGWLRRARSLRIQEALSFPGMAPAVLWWLIANNEVWADLNEELVEDKDTSSIHISQPLMLASRHLREPLAVEALSDRIDSVRVEPGFHVLWDGEPFVILNRGKMEVALQYTMDGKRVVTIPCKEFWKLLRRGSIQGDEDSLAAKISAARRELLRFASDAALRTAEHRYQLLLAYEEFGVVPAEVARRTIERFAAWAREGVKIYGNKFFGLIRSRGRKRGTPDLDEARVALLAEMVGKYGGDTGGAGYTVVHREMRRRSKELGIWPPSFILDAATAAQGGTCFRRHPR